MESQPTTKLATPLSVVHVPTRGNTDPPRDCGSLPSEYIPSRIYSTKYIHGKVPGSRGSGLKLPGRAFSVLPARSLSQPGARSILVSRLFCCSISFQSPFPYLSPFALTFSSTLVSSVHAHAMPTCVHTRPL